MRFTLEVGQWYACEFISGNAAEDSTCFSPIKVLAVTPKGNRTFKLEFWHANYPEGVQNKEYLLQTLERGDKLILASTKDSGFCSFLKIHDISVEWLGKHFPEMRPDGKYLARWLDQTM